MSSHSRSFSPDGAGSHPAVVWSIFLVWTIVGCAGNQTPLASTSQNSNNVNNPPPQSKKVISADKAAKVALSAPTMRRSDLLGVLQRGPHAFLKELDVRPLLRSGRFVGWKIMAYRRSSALKQGDVVTRVNAQSVERPDEFFAVWRSLGKAEHLTVDVLREGKKLTLRYEITD
jgi:type II secretory pathway component PulC